MTDDSLFDPIRIGPMGLRNRIVMAPMTRFRAPDGVLDSDSADYYEHNRTVDDIGNQRANLTAEIWKYLLEEAKDDLDAYHSSKTTVDAAISGIEADLAIIRGSVSESGMTNNRVVVFDDPVSSLDSDILFIVSSLIKRVFKLSNAQNSQIRQVFVLTHNIYFHKEVSFDPNRKRGRRAHETFWIVKKINDVSKLEPFDHNPIKTSYELLWSEVRNENRSNLTIQNTLRRILENYFKILGNMNKDKIIEKFEGREKVICASLFSWVNDGSHSAHDDLYVSSDATTVEAYLGVFRRIFEETGHTQHYHMMMGTEGYWYKQKTAGWAHCPPSPDLDKLMAFLGGMTNTLPMLIYYKGAPSFGHYIVPRKDFIHL